MPILSNKYELYQQVLKLEFIREFYALVEAANDRGEFKADFTDKILALFGKIIEPAVDAANIVLPAVPAILKAGTEFLIESKNEARKEQKTQYFLQKGFTYNPNELSVLAEQMSITALKRYQWFVSQLDHESVIRFAKAGVERVLEYLARRQLPLSIEHLLDGLLKGHSGAYVSGYFNTQLTPVNYLAERIPPSSRIKGALGFSSVTAEGMYGRSAFMTYEEGSSRLYLHALFDKSKAKHIFPKDKQLTPEDKEEKNRFEKIKYLLSNEGRERWFDYGYSKSHVEYKREPKYGYALVTPAEVNGYYGAKQNITTRNLIDLESKLKDSLETFSYEIIPFNKTHLKNYLHTKNEIPQLTLLAYLKELFNAKNARLAYFDADKDKNSGKRDVSDLDLSGAHLDDCVFDYSIFPADLSNTTLRNSFLRYADFREVKQAKKLDLSGAHAEYLDARGAILSDAIMRNADFFGANFTRAHLKGADTLGANLVGSILAEIVSPITNLQEIQEKQEELSKKQQLLEDKQSTQSEEMAALRKRVSELQASNRIDIAEKLDEFIQECAAREALERYCRSEIEKLNIQAQQQAAFSQQQAEHLESLKRDLADLHKLQAVSQKDGENLLTQFKKLSANVDEQGSLLGHLNQALDQLTTSTQNQATELNQLGQRLTLLEEFQAKREQEEKKPQPPHLSDERLQQIKQELFASYQKRAVMFEFAPNQTTPITLPITEKTFVHLALVAQAQQQQKERELRKELKQNPSEVEEEGVYEKAKNEQDEPQIKTDKKNDDVQRQQLLNSWEMLSQVQEPINVNELWLEHKSDKSIPQHLLIEGSAGIGKTTLCGFIAAQWSQQKLWTDLFEWVLWIPLRNLIDTSRYPLAAGYSVKTFVFGECFGCLPNTEQLQLAINEQDELWRQIKEKSERVLYILDGYDEIAGYEKRPELTHLKTAFSQLLQSQHILLTTRPQVINAELLKKQQTRRLVTLGLSDENIPLYVKNYFKAISSYSEEKSLSLVEEKTANIAPLLKGLKANQTLWSVSHVPLHLSLICLAYAEGMIKAADLKQSLSLTQLYQKIVNILLYRYFLKENLKGTIDTDAKRVEADDVELEPNTQLVAQFLEVFAFRGIGQYDLILDKELLNESLKATNQTFAIIPSLIASGLLKEVNDQGKAAYQFVHLTFQEFFAARFLARRFKQPQPSINDWIERFHEYKHIPRFAVMLWFTAGLLKDKPLHLQQYIQLLQAPPRDEVGLYHLGLVMRCIAEAGYPKELTTQVSQYLGQLVEKYWVVIKEKIFSKDGNIEIKERLAQHVLKWLGQQRLLTPKIEFPVLSLNVVFNDLSYQSLVFKNRDKEVRRVAARILGTLITLTHMKMLSLEVVALLNDEEYYLRQAATRAPARAPGELKTLTPEILEGIVDLPKDSQWKAKRAAANALGELKTPTPEILQGLVALLKDEKYDVREAAALALGELKAPTPEILQGLVALLKDNDSDVRQAAAQALGELKTPTPEILQGLVALLNDNISYVRLAAAVALGKLKAPTFEIFQTMDALLKHNDSYIRQAASRALGELKIPTPEILQSLVALLKDNDSDVRQAAAEALENFSIASLLNIYFQESCQWYQSYLQEWLLSFIAQRWLANKQVVKIVNQEVYWLEQGQWQHLPIPNTHPYFQHYLAKTMQDLVGPPLTLNFPKLSASENVTLFSPRSSFSVQPSAISKFKDPRPK